MFFELFRTVNFRVIKDGTDIGCNILCRITGKEVAHLQGDEYLDLREKLDAAPSVRVQDMILDAYDY